MILKTAFDVLENIINDEIFPKQIVVEFEYSEDDVIHDEKFKCWATKLKNLVDEMKIKIINVIIYQGTVIILFNYRNFIY